MTILKLQKKYPRLYDFIMAQVQAEIKKLEDEELIRQAEKIKNNREFIPHTFDISHSNHFFVIRNNGKGIKTFDTNKYLALYQKQEDKIKKQMDFYKNDAGN